MSQKESTRIPAGVSKCPEDTSGAEDLDHKRLRERFAGSGRASFRAGCLLGLLIALQSVAGQSLTPAFVQAAGHDNGALDRPFCTASFPSNNTAGNLILVAVEIGDAGISPPVHPVVSDTQGNAYYPVTSQITWLTTGNGASAQLFYAPNIRGGPNTVTMTELGSSGGAGNAWNQIAIHEYAGLSIASPLDVSAPNTGTSATGPSVISSAQITPTLDEELVFGYGNILNAIPAAGPGFTMRQTGVGTSEDLVQLDADPVVATELVNATNAPYVMLVAAFKPSIGASLGPVLPPQADRVGIPFSSLTITNAAAEINTNPLTTSTILFTYPDRASLLADGWSFIATNAGAARDTEVTNAASDGLVSYDQSAHPGTLRIPCDQGDLLGAVNTSRNSLFHSLPSNWVSARLQFTFAPATNYQKANLMLYQDDNNYIEIGLGCNTDLNNEFGGEVVRMIAETNGQATSFYTRPFWYTGGPGSPLVTNICLRLDRNLMTGRVSALNSIDGTNWAFIGEVGQALLNPRISVWVGGSPVPYVDGLPACDVQQLDILAAVPPPVFTYQLLDPPAGAAIDPAGVIRWTPTMAQHANTYTMMTVATDNQEPPLSATNSFDVWVDDPPLPQILSVGLSNQVASVTWSTISGQAYQLQYSSDLSPASWQIAIPSITASGPTITATNMCGNAAARFYRTIWLMP